MSQQIIEMVRELRADAVGASRNRNFERYEGESGRRALRLHRLLRSLERDLSRCALLAAARHRGGVRITVRHTALSLTRTVHLSEAELGLLDDAPALAGRIRRELDS